VTVTVTVSASTTCTTTISPTLVPTPVPKVSYFYPNPFHPDRAEIFRIKLNSNTSNASVTIYDMVGRKVRSFTGAELSASGTGWDGKNQNGVTVVSGIYFVVVSGDSNVYRVGVIRN
jgi:flagellar hook assembly protein FlgD